MASSRGVPAPLLVRVDGSAPPIRLNRPLTIVGSKLQSHLRIVSAAISGSHALLLNLGNNILLRDLMSRSHVYVNDREVAECRLKYGDVVRFGEMRFRFLDQDVLRESLEKFRSPPARFDLEDAEPVNVSSPLFVIGRQQGADLVLEDEEVSKAHAVLFEHAGQRILRDLGSRRGTIVDGRPIRAVSLRGGEVIRIGRTILRYQTSSPVVENQGDTEQNSSQSVVELQQNDMAPVAEEESELAAEPAASDEAPPDSHVFVEEAVVVDSPSSLAPATDEDLEPWSDHLVRLESDEVQLVPKVELEQAAPPAVERQGKFEEPKPTAPPQIPPESPARSGGRLAADPLSEFVGDGLLTMSSESDLEESAPPAATGVKSPPRHLLLVAVILIAVLAIAAVAAWHRLFGK